MEKAKPHYLLSEIQAEVVRRGAAAFTPGFDSSRPKANPHFNEIKHLAVLFDKCCNGTISVYMRCFTL